MSDSIQIPNVTAEEIDHVKWKNKDVIKWYKNIPIDLLRDYAIKGGLEEGCDMDILYPYIANTQSLIEVGAAYGRGLRHLIRKGYQGKIYALECSENFYHYLKAHYSEKAEIILSDIQLFNPGHTVDAILWLWAGISDFSKEEHLPILKHMCTWLNRNGILIIETLLHTLIPKNTAITIERREQNSTISTEYGNLYAYSVSNDEIQIYGKQLKFKHIKHINYETFAHRHRILHLFSNKLI